MIVLQQQIMNDNTDLSPAPSFPAADRTPTAVVVEGGWEHAEDLEEEGIIFASQRIKSIPVEPPPQLLGNLLVNTCSGNQGSSGAYQSSVLPPYSICTPISRISVHFLNKIVGLFEVLKL